MSGHALIAPTQNPSAPWVGLFSACATVGLKALHWHQEIDHLISLGIDASSQHP